MKRLIPFLALAALAAVFLAATVTPAKVSPQKNTTVYFGDQTFAHAHYTDTLVWTKDRNFADTSYDCAVFLTGSTTTGVLSAKVLNDSSIIVASDTPTDSTLTYFYQVLLQKH